MSNQTVAQVAATLNLSATAVLELSKNPGFPARVSGNGLSTLWDSTAIGSFAALWSSAKSHGWKIPVSIMPTANIAAMAAAAPGSRYTALPGSDPLFDS